MDITKMLAELRPERENIEQAIQRLDVAEAGKATGMDDGSQAARPATGK